MKLYKSLIAALTLTMGVASCSDWLEQEPPSYLVSEGYFNNNAEVKASVDNFYTIISTHGQWDFGTYGRDNETDNQVDWNPDNKYGTGLWLTATTDGNWAWENIRKINFNIRTIWDKVDGGTLDGNSQDLKQYIGEFYFFRAYCYFDMLQKWGDLPIVTEALPDEEAILVAANRRYPRNEVARFIISDLDSALTYMAPQGTYETTRATPDAVKLFKSRVALYEGTFEKYFDGTPFVPGGSGWPGAAKDYNSGFSIDLASESRYFLQLAAETSKEIADKYMSQLRINTGTIPQSATDPENPYFSVWGTTDMSGIPEVLMWREYNRTLGVLNDIEVQAAKGNYGIGVTRGYVESYLMADGRPRYASEYEYCDTSLHKVRENRDPRLTIFLKEPGQVNEFINRDNPGDHAVLDEPVPNIAARGDAENGYPTGYAIRKGATFDAYLSNNGGCYNACEVFRATEALLNYMEAQYLLTENLADIMPYWRAVRQAAGFTGTGLDPQVTIDATDMAQEVADWNNHDWGAYSGGQLIDKTLYCIRRERRSEMIGEGLRWMDLQRWRSLDQLINRPVHIEGMHLYNTPILSWYWATEGEDQHYVYDENGNHKLSFTNDGTTNAQVSSESLSEYMRPHEWSLEQNSFIDGLTWHMAHYLRPLPTRQFLLTSSDYQSYEKSMLYQNPYWPTDPDLPAEQ